MPSACMYGISIAQSFPAHICTALTLIGDSALFMLFQQLWLYAGNHSFAKSYNQMIPDTWNVINDQVCFKMLVLQQIHVSAFMRLSLCGMYGAKAPAHSSSTGHQHPVSIQHASFLL